jgi:hypothetical protein
MYIPSIFLLSIIVPSYGGFHRFKNSIFILAVFTFLASFFYPASLVCDLPLAWPVFHNIVCICIGSIFHIGEKMWT